MIDWGAVLAFALVGAFAPAPLLAATGGRHTERPGRARSACLLIVVRAAGQRWATYGGRRRERLTASARGPPRRLDQGAAGRSNQTRTHPPTVRRSSQRSGAFCYVDTMGAPNFFELRFIDHIRQLNCWTAAVLEYLKADDLCIVLIKTKRQIKLPDTWWIRLIYWPSYGVVKFGGFVMGLGFIGMREPWAHIGLLCLNSLRDACLMTWEADSAPRRRLPPMRYKGGWHARKRDCRCIVRMKIGQSDADRNE